MGRLRLFVPPGFYPANPFKRIPKVTLSLGQLYERVRPNDGNDIFDIRLYVGCVGGGGRVEEGPAMGGRLEGHFLGGAGGGAVNRARGAQTLNCAGYAVRVKQAW